MNLGTAPRGGGGSRDLVNSGGGRGADSGAVPAAPRGSGLRRGEAGGAADPGSCAGLAGPRAGGARPLSEGSNLKVCAITREQLGTFSAVASSS